jgi:Na+-driven multidrug efflux pump
MNNLCRTMEGYRVNPRLIRFDWPILKQIVIIGLPAGLQSVIISLSNVIVQSRINLFGSQAMAGISSSGRIDGFIYMPMNAFGLAITTFVGQNIGAGRIDRIRRATKVCLLMSAAATAVLSLAVGLFREPLLGLVSQDPEVLRYGIMMLTMTCSCYIVFSTCEPLNGVMRGAGSAVPPMVISIVNMCLIRILWLYGVMAVWYDIRVVIYCYPVTWALTSIMMTIYYLKGGWRKKIGLDGPPQAPLVPGADTAA